MSVQKVNQTTGELSPIAGGTFYADAPVGTIQAYGGSSAPTGWMLCQGQALSRTTYSELFAIIGTSFGSGDGSTTFNIPDLRGEFLRGAGTNSHTGEGSGGAVGEHQDATQIPNIYAADTNCKTLYWTPNTAGAYYADSVITQSSGYYLTTQQNQSTTANPNARYMVRPTNTSINYIIKVVSNALPSDFADVVDDMISEKQDQIDDIVNVYGAKNINSYPYAYTTREINGITFTDNGDGTVTANGTATADAQFNFHERLITGSSNLILPNGDYIISGCPSGGATTKYYINANMTKNGNPTVLGTDIGNGATITLNGDDYSQDNVHLGFFIKIKSGQTVSNLLFKPMIRLASIKDNTYEPYAKTNIELTKDKAEQAEVDDIVNVYGSKNLLPYPYYNTTLTKNGLTFTDNGDGTITCNGTATADTQFFFDNLTASDKINNPIVGGRKYILSSKEIGTENAFVWVRAYYTPNKIPSESVQCYVNDNSKSQMFDLTDYPIIYAFRSGIFIKSGHTVNNLIFEPMIRCASISDDTYEPYAKTNRELTIDKAEQKEVNDINNVYGAKNLLRQPYFMSKLSNHYIHGVSVNVQEDGSIITNGTVSESNVNIYLTNVIDDNRFAGKILSGCPQGGNGEYYLRARIGLKDDTFVSQAIDNGNGVVIPEIDTETQHIQIWLIIATNTTVNNVVFKPMIREASVVDNTYEPYVPTNEQLVNDVGELTENTGVKNFVPYPYWETTKEVNGITFTDNGDGTVEVSGTATDVAQFTIVPRVANAGLKIPKGTYILSGCPSGGYQSTGVMYRLNCSFSNSSYVISDVGDGIGALVEVTEELANEYFGLFITISSLAEITTPITFKPMLRLASIKDDTYTPYAETNKQLTNRMNTFTGTRAEWTALNNYQKNKYQLVDLTDDGETGGYEEFTYLTVDPAIDNVTFTGFKDGNTVNITISWQSTNGFTGYDAMFTIPSKYRPKNDSIIRGNGTLYNLNDLSTHTGFYSLTSSGNICQGWAGAIAFAGGSVSFTYPID